MDIKEAIRLLEMGRLEDLDVDVLWELEEVLASGIDTQGYYIRFKNIVSGRNNNFPGFVKEPLPQRALALKPRVEANIKAVREIEEEVNLFAVDEKGRLKNPEVEPVFNFYKRIVIENKKEADKVNAEDFFQNLTAMAVLDTHEKIYQTPHFARCSKEEQIKTYQNTLLMSLQETAFILVSNQEIEDRSDKCGNELKSREIEDKLQQVTESRELETLHISNQNIIGTLSAGMNRLRNASRRLCSGMGIKNLDNEIKAVDIKFSRSYPDNYPAMKPLSRGMGIAFIAGPVGRSSYGAWNIEKTLRTETTAVDRNNEDLFSYIRQKPNMLKLLGHKIADSVSRVIETLRCAGEAGMINKTVARNWKSFTALLRPHGKGKSARLNEARFHATLASVNAKTEFAVSQKGSPQIIALLKEIAGSRIGRMFTGRKQNTVKNGKVISVAAGRE